MDRESDPKPESELAVLDTSFGDESGRQLPGVLLGHATPEVAQSVERFYCSVAAMLETWIQRTQSPNTQRTYRRSVMSFVEFMDIGWPDDCRELLAAGVPDVRAWRDFLAGCGQAPATLNARLAALSGFYRFMREVSVSELKLPIQVPNPAHSQFISRESPDPVSPTTALTLAKAKRLLAFPSREHILAGDALLSKRWDEASDQVQGDLEVLVARDRAVLSVFLYTGARIGSVCALDTQDFHDDEDDPTVRFREKGRSRSKRVIGLNFICADALRDYLEQAAIRRGPLFRARCNPRSARLGEARMSQASMYRLLLGYLERVPGAMFDADDGGRRCRYSPHSLRATTATLLDDAGVPIKRIQELLGHKDIRVTQSYIKVLGGTKQSASHEVPL